LNVENFFCSLTFNETNISLSEEKFELSDKRLNTTHLIDIAE